jgi:hypothetical protein
MDAVAFGWCCSAAHDIIAIVIAVLLLGFVLVFCILALVVIEMIPPRRKENIYQFAAYFCCVR